MNIQQEKIWNAETHDEANINSYYVLEPQTNLGINASIAPNGSHLDALYQEYQLNPYPRGVMDPFQTTDIFDFNENPLGGSVPAISNLASEGGPIMAFALDDLGDLVNRADYDRSNPLMTPANPLSAVYAEKVYQQQLETQQKHFTPNSLINHQAIAYSNIQTQNNQVDSLNQLFKGWGNTADGK